MANEKDGGATKDPIEALAAELVDDFTEHDPAKPRLSREDQIARVAASIREVAAATATPARPTADQKIQNIVDESKAETERGRAARRQS
jgi:hypothetical protein